MIDNDSMDAWRLNLTQAAFEKSTFALIGHQRERSLVALCCFQGGSDTTQQIGSRGVQEVIAVEIAGSGERIDKRERRLGAVSHRNRHSSVQRHDRRGLEPLEKIVEPDDLRPVGIFGPRCPAMRGGDRRLHRERTGLSAKRFIDQWQGFRLSLIHI